MVQLGHLIWQSEKSFRLFEKENQDKLMLAGQITKFELILQLLGVNFMFPVHELYQKLKSKHF